MLPELTLIKLFLSRDMWLEHSSKLSAADLPKELQPVWRVLENHFAANDEGLSTSDLSNRFFATVPTRDREYYAALFDNLARMDTPSADSCLQLINSIHINRLLREASIASYEASEGRKEVGVVLDTLKSIERLQEASRGLKIDSVDGSDPDFLDDDLERLIHTQKAKPGLRWRLNTLNQIFGSLRKGDFGFVFARPEVGKTTFLASEGSFMAEQLPDEHPLLHFNNEEQSDKVLLRYYQATLGIDLVELQRDIQGNLARYRQKVGNRIKMVNREAIHYRDVEKFCEKYEPGLIILDQIDKIHGFDNERDDLRLGTLYQWAREIAKKYCPVIAVCQADGSGEGQRWLTMTNVSLAKTSKQAEADWILGIGSVHDIGFENIRYLHASKNKLIGDEFSVPELRHAKTEVLIEPEIARYKDLLH